MKTLFRFLPRVLIFSLSLMTVSSTVQAAELKPFISDGCTLFPEGTRREPKLWEVCCYEHDLRFWAGGSKQSRNRADSRLRQCVNEYGAELTADLMFIGVRLGRLSPIKFPTKTWGNAWPVHGYRKLSDRDVDVVLRELSQYAVPSDVELRFVDAIRLDAGAN